MNIGLITSFIISGILILMLGFMNIGVSQNSTEVVLSQFRQSQKYDVQELVTFDLPKIGYDFNLSIDTAIVYGDDKKLVFYSNVDNSSDGSIETITWEFTSTGINETVNPNDKVLTRTVDSELTEIKTGVTLFEFAYYDSLGSTTSLAIPLSNDDRAKVVQIGVTLKIESDEKVKTRTDKEGSYLITMWNKRFSPRNLKNNLN
ncbi:hypothetical protein [Balneola vulgaris]|uniref:hypothetical protein n=1 Tax=Balneola vulgaris TaxID=287535 RepID=UPI0003663503|nr:hypothetical protein [Balneola vulgaris]